MSGPFNGMESLGPLCLVLQWDGKPRSFGPSDGMESLGPLCLLLKVGWKTLVLCVWSF